MNTTLITLFMPPKDCFGDFGFFCGFTATPNVMGQIRRSFTGEMARPVLAAFIHPTMNAISDISGLAWMWMRLQDPRRLSFCLKDCVIRLRPGPIDGVAITGPVSVIGPPDAPRIAVKFGDGWFNTERTALQYWRWTQGPAELVVVNRNDAAVSGALHFAIHAISKRNVVLANADGQVLWGAEVSSKHSETARVTGLRFEPGETRFFLRSDMPASGADNDTRLLDMIVKDLVLEAGP